MKRPSRQDNSATAAAPAANNVTHDYGPATQASPLQFCSELSKLFRVRANEVALLRVQGRMLRFLFPEELKAAGTIALSSSSSIAAHTAISKKTEPFNNFPRVKHASIFETVKLAQQSEQPDPLTIRKLISGPVRMAKCSECFRCAAKVLTCPRLDRTSTSTTSGNWSMQPTPWRKRRS
jgi:hypothetical protein